MTDPDAQPEPMPKLPRRAAPRGAADYVELRAAYVSFVLGDVVEHLGLVIQHWAHAALAVRNDPDGALTQLVEAEIDLSGFVQTGVAEVMRATRAGSARLERELPDDDVDS